LSNGQKLIDRCRELAQISDNADGTFRTFLSPGMRRCYETVTYWMESAGMQVHIDDAGNLRGVFPGDGCCAQPLLMGSHLDTVRNAGAFDGILGVILAIELVEMLGSRKLPFDIQVVGFSEEEGVRFSTPFIGSRALAGSLTEEFLALRDAAGISVAQAIRDFGLDPNNTAEIALKPVPLAFLEFHIEQGPVLDHASESLALVDTIAGLTRARVTFTGHANHAGTTPMNLRSDALCGAAEWITEVERTALATSGLVTTVGKLDVTPGVANAVPGEVTMTLDCRHADDSVRFTAVKALRASAIAIADGRQLTFKWADLLNQAATPMHAGMVELLNSAARQSGLSLRRMASGAGHDAMILAACMPAAMLFLRSPRGISHHPDEAVMAEDIDNALAVGGNFLKCLSQTYKQWETS
jgi:allantoate deiminase